MTISNLPSSELNRGVFENCRRVTILVQFIVGFEQRNHGVWNSLREEHGHAIPRHYESFLSMHITWQLHLSSCSI